MSASRVALVALVLALGLGGIVFLSRSLRLAAELEATGAARARAQEELAESLERLAHRERELLEALRRCEAEREALRNRVAELALRIEELAAAAVAPPAHETEPEELSPEEVAVIEIAEVAAAEIAAASEVPFVAFEDLPLEYQDELAPTRGRALYIRYPPNRWGTDGIGVIQVRVKEGGTWQGWLPLDSENRPLFRRLAELSYLEQLAEEEMIEELIRDGEGAWYPDRKSAEAALDGLMVRHESGETGGWLREDPQSGRTWVCAGTIVLDSSRIRRLREQRMLLASLLLAGRGGSVSSGWRHK